MTMPNRHVVILGHSIMLEKPVALIVMWEEDLSLSI